METYILKNVINKNSGSLNKFIQKTLLYLSQLYTRKTFRLNKGLSLKRTLDSIAVAWEIFTLCDQSKFYQTTNSNSFSKFFNPFNNYFVNDNAGVHFIGILQCHFSKIYIQKGQSRSKRFLSNLFVYFTRDNHRLVIQWLKTKMTSKYAINSHKWPVLLQGSRKSCKSQHKVASLKRTFMVAYTMPTSEYKMKPNYRALNLDLLS